MNRCIRLTAAILLTCSIAFGADLSGKWAFTWDTQGGIRRSTMTMTQDGDKLSAKNDGTDLSGSVTGDTFELTGKLHASEAGYTSDLEISGKVADGALKGEATWDAYPMTFTAKRTE